MIRKTPPGFLHARENTEVFEQMQAELEEHANFPALSVEKRNGMTERSQRTWLTLLVTRDKFMEREGARELPDAIDSECLSVNCDLTPLVQ